MGPVFLILFETIGRVIKNTVTLFAVVSGVLFYALPRLIGMIVVILVVVTIGPWLRSGTLGLLGYLAWIILIGFASLVIVRIARSK